MGLYTSTVGPKSSHIEERLAYHDIISENVLDIPFVDHTHE